MGSSFEKGAENRSPEKSFDGGLIVAFLGFFKSVGRGGVEPKLRRGFGFTRAKIFNGNPWDCWGVDGGSRLGCGSIATSFRKISGRSCSCHMGIAERGLAELAKRPGQSFSCS